MSYDWGSYGEIEKYFGIANPPGKPLAELWFGAHRKAPAMIAENEHFSLRDLLVSHGEDILGKELYKRYAGEFPFLLKILSARKGLSIQAHPSKAQAEAGFAREEEQGIDISAPERNYRDDNHKPECIVAVSEFWALSGFRRPDSILNIFQHVEEQGGECALLSRLKTILEYDNSENRLQDFYTGLMNAGQDELEELMESSRRAAEKEDPPELPDGDEERIWYWLQELRTQFPGDPGTLAPLYLNVVKLNPGQGLFMHAGVLHAYLAGTGIELMANSDNVLRGGCTSKHVDVPELISVLDFSPFLPGILTPDSRGWYDSPVPEFRIARVQLDDGAEETELRRDMELGEAPAILLVEQGSLGVQQGDDAFSVRRGDALFIPAERELEGQVTGITLSAETGKAVFALATVNARSGDKE